MERETQRQKLVKESFLAYQKRLRKALAGTGLTEGVSSAESLRRIQIVRAVLRLRKALAGTGLTEGVSSAESLRRIQIVRAVLQAGISLAKVDYLRPLLKPDRNERLTDSSHLSLYVPLLLEEEVKQLKEELKEARFFP